MSENLSLAVIFGLSAALVGGGAYMIANTDFQGEAQKAVENSGMTNVNVEYSLLTTFAKCGQDDLIGFNFSGKNPQGKNVGGYVCTGLMKGSTVRW